MSADTATVDELAALREAAAGAGVALPDEILVDGVAHRIDGGRAWYVVLDADGTTGAAFSPGTGGGSFAFGADAHAFPRGAVEVVIAGRLRRAVVRMHAAEAPPPATDSDDELEVRRIGDSFVELLSGTSVKPEPVRWLWRGYLARGCLHVAAGAPGVGKSTLMLALAAVISRGTHWPDGSRLGQARDVAIWSGEDDVSRTLLPRFIAMGGDPARIWFVGNTEAREGRRPFDPATDMRELHAALAGRDIGFLGVDPVVSAVLGDGHHNADVRRSLQPLVDLAEALDCVVFGLSHFSKGTAGRDPVERVTGSVAFGALPRLVFAVAKDGAEDADDRRLFVRAKSNLGPDGGGFVFRLDQLPVPGYPGITASCIAWTGSVNGAARDLLAVAEVTDDADERSAGAAAVEFLKDLLTNAEVPARQIKREAEEAGHSWRTVQRSARNMGVVVRRSGFGKGATYLWALPMRANDEHACHSQSVAHMDNFGAHGADEPVADVQDSEIEHPHGGHGEGEL